MFGGGGTSAAIAKEVLKNKDAARRRLLNVGMFKSLNGLILENHDGIATYALIDSVCSLVGFESILKGTEPDAIGIIIIPVMNRHVAAVCGTGQIPVLYVIT